MSSLGTPIVNIKFRIIALFWQSRNKLVAKNETNLAEAELQLFREAKGGGGGGGNFMQSRCRKKFRSIERSPSVT